MSDAVFGVLCIVALMAGLAALTVWAVSGDNVRRYELRIGGHVYQCAEYDSADTTCTQQVMGPPLPGAGS